MPATCTRPEGGGGGFTLCQSEGTYQIVKVFFSICCRLFSLKNAYKRGGHRHPRTPLATPLHNTYVWRSNKLWVWVGGLWTQTPKNSLWQAFVPCSPSRGKAVRDEIGKPNKKSFFLPDPSPVHFARLVCLSWQLHLFLCSSPGELAR